jgi:hypothetical protein
VRRRQRAAEHGVTGGRAAGRPPPTLCGPPPTARPRRQAHSPDASDLLPGTYMLARGWVTEAVLASFRDTAGQEADLDGWFQSPWVQAYVQARLSARSFGPSNLGKAVAAAAAALASFIASLVARLLAALQKSGVARGGAAAPALAAAGAGAAVAVAAAAMPVAEGRAPPQPHRAAPAAEPEPEPAAAQAQQAGPRAAAVEAQFQAEAAEAVLEFDRSKLEKEVVTIAELKRRLGAVLSEGQDGTSPADKWRQAGGDGGAAAGEAADKEEDGARRWGGRQGRGLLPRALSLLHPTACARQLESQLLRRSLYHAHPPPLTPLRG